ncbi:efflux RND transporter periplasmic adaptor subunit [Planctomycetota bacterium]|nr:efflux RND transporter periplasmic adaptor subunit [Planctomycetota bacterium]
MKARLLIFSIFGGFILIVVCIGYLRSGQSYEMQEPRVKNAVPVASVNITKQPHVIKESFFGLIEPDSRVDMGFQITGRITQLGEEKGIANLNSGQRVKKGEVIARLEQDRYVAQLASAEASRQQATALIAASKAMITDAEARLNDAVLERDRVVRLQKSNAATQRELERSQLSVTLAQVAVENAKAKELEAKAQLESAEASKSVASVNLRDTTLVSPIDATVATVPAELGQMVSPTDNVATLVDINNVNLAIGVVERKLGLLKLGQEVDVYIEALRNGYGDREAGADLIYRKGLVTTIPPMAADATGLFNVDIEIDNSDGSLRPGMIGRADVRIRTVNAYAIPADAVRKKGNRIIAFVVDENLESGTAVAKRLELMPDYMDNEFYLITEMPEKEMTLITEGNSMLVDGEVVKLAEEKGGSLNKQNSIYITASEDGVESSTP